MKTKILLFLSILIFSSILSFAQENKHLEFMGIPITGDIDIFSRKLQAKGFKPESIEEGIHYLSGRFTNTYVILGLISTDRTNDIYKVGLLYDSSSSWESIESHQNYLVELFSKKYGKATNSVRDIPSMYKDSGSYIFIGLYNENIQYYDTWILPNGVIQISIIPDSPSSSQIRILYEDKIGTSKLEEQILNEI